VGATSLQETRFKKQAFKKQGSRNKVQETRFKKQGSRNKVQGTRFKKQAFKKQAFKKQAFKKLKHMSLAKNVILSPVYPDAFSSASG
jgi:hypothetical protein